MFLQSMTWYLQLLEPVWHGRRFANSSNLGFFNMDSTCFSSIIGRARINPTFQTRYFSCSKWPTGRHRFFHHASLVNPSTLCRYLCISDQNAISRRTGRIVAARSGAFALYNWVYIGGKFCGSGGAIDGCDGAIK